MSKTETKTETILVVDDDEMMRESCCDALEHHGYKIWHAPSPRHAEPILLKEEIDLIVTDLRMPDGGGEEVMRLARNICPGVAIIVITAFPSVQSAIGAFKSGVVDYLLKPFSQNQLLEAVDSALCINRAKDRADFLRKIGPADSQMPQMIGTSPRFHALLGEIRRTAPLDGHVLILGETGSGKELVSRAIHNFSRRAAGPFVVVNSSALPESLVEAELLGFEKGAFTGAQNAKPGLIEESHAGTLFLDEIGDLPLAAQAKLLRALEEKVIRRVGGLKGRPVDLRVVAATHKDLREEIKAGRFREDIFYRLSALEIHVPALREHPEDIPQLAVYFLDKLCLAGQDSNQPVVGFSEEALSLLVEYHWPGNIRELQNSIQKAFVKAQGPLIMPEDLSFLEIIPGANAKTAQTPGSVTASGRRTVLTQFEREYLVEALNRCDNNITQTAQALGIHRTTLQRLMKKYCIASSYRG